MYFKKKIIKQILSVDDNFFNIVSIDKSNNTILADLYYNVNQYAAVKEEALSVSVSVISKKTKLESIITAEDNSISALKVIEKLTTQIRDININAKNQEQFVVAHRNSDITSKINNEIIPFLKTGIAKDAVTKTTVKSRLVEKLKSEGSTTPNISIKNSYLPVSSSVAQNESKKVINNLLFKQQKDPSSFINSFNSSLTSTESRDGFFHQKLNEGFNVAKLSSIVNSTLSDSKSNISDFIDSEYIDVLTTEKQINLSIPIRIMLPISSLVDGIDKSNYIFKFDLISSRTKLSIDSVIKEVELYKHIKFFITPKIAPTVKITNSANSRVIIDVTQNDINANSVNVYKKSISKVLTGNDDYIFLGNFETGKINESTLIRLPSQNMKSTSVYRVIPVYDGTEGYDFTNVVTGTDKDYYLKSISISAYSEQDGIRIEARNIPPDLVSIKFVSKNLTLFEKHFSTVNNTVLLVTDGMKSNDYVSLVDSSVKDNNIYEYRSVMIFNTGVEVEAGSCIVERTSNTQQGLVTKVENITQQDDDVSFSISTKSISTNLDFVLDILRKQNVDSYFSSEIFSEKEKLSSMIAHNVQRVDLDTGKRNDFGIILDDSFVESSYRDLSNIDAFDKNKKYRYEITAVLRNPESIFESEQEKTDVATQKQYRFSPVKFKHPINKRSGMLVSSAGMNLKFAKNTFMYGLLGNTINVDVGVDKPRTVVSNLKADFVNMSYSIVSWTVDNLNDVDHFIVFAESSGNSFAIGKVHSNFQNNFCYFMHDMSKNKFNTTRYAILPIYKSYDVGTLEYSNLLNR